MPALAQRAGTKNYSINYNFGQKRHEGPAPGVRIHICFGLGLTKLEFDNEDQVLFYLCYTNWRLLYVMV